MRISIIMLLFKTGLLSKNPIVHLKNQMYLSFPFCPVHMKLNKNYSTTKLRDQIENFNIYKTIKFINQKFRNNFKKILHA